ncbi:hypothetical protein [Aquisphaera insulae]|uniref:hypothetical protein n=1 Tax=Aquisphaera insulae TaxID=2712864 RepID=UPI0013EAE77A|nr:hypothetical protein [Aquisphaera insulae]
MSSKILNFLVSLANDPDLMSEFVRAPDRTMVRCGLDANEVALMRSRDARAIAAAASISIPEPVPAPRHEAPTPSPPAAHSEPSQAPVSTPQVPGTMIVYGPVYFFMNPPAAAAAPAVEPPSPGVVGKPAASGVALISPPPMTTFTHMIPIPHRPWTPTALRVTPFSPIECEGEASREEPAQPPKSRIDEAPG